MPKYNQQTPYVIYPQPEHKPAKETGLHSLVAGAQLPLLQALISGLMVAVLVAYMAYQAMWLDWLSAGLIAGLIVALIVWGLQIKSWSKLAWYIEQATGIDLPGDYQPEPDRIVLDIADKRDGAYSVNRLYLDCSLETMQRFARNALAGKLSEKDNRRIFGDLETWISVRDELEARALIEWKSADRARGVRLTQKGQRAMRQLLSSPAPLEQKYE
jgi:signal transduction histidine kinase